MTDRPDPSQEPDLLKRARRGSRQAFCGLVWLHQGAVRAYLSRCSRRRDVVDDLAQEVFVVAFRKLGDYQGESSLRLWLLGIARNQWRMHARSEARRRARESKRLELELARQGAALLDDAPLEDHDRELKALSRCLETLPDRNAEIVQAFYFEGCSAKAIAERLDRKASAVRMTLLRVRRTLRSCVEQRLAEAV